jgi:hypothetical protein
MGARAVRQLSRGHRLKIPLLIGVVVVAAAVVVGIVVGRHPKPADAGSAQIDTSSDLLASTVGQASGDVVDGIDASSTEQVLFHVHAHLAVYVNGQQELLPYGIGIVPPYRLQNTASGPFVVGGSKFYWLHTHDETGIIHIESPQQRTFTLGDLFDIWHQILGPSQVGPAAGPVNMLVNNHPVGGDPRVIPLGAHDVIQLNVGSPEPFHAYAFPNGV